MILMLLKLIPKESHLINQQYNFEILQYDLFGVSHKYSGYEFSG